MLDYHHWNDTDETTPQPHSSTNTHHFTFPYDTFLHPDPFYDCTTPCYPQPPPIPIPSTDAAFLIAAKEEEDQASPLPPSTADHTAARLGLNLGGRTYFSSADEELVRRMYNSSSHGRTCSGIVGFNSSSNTPRCQAEGCYADLSSAKHYHRRHKVCEYHSKAATVFSAGITQRFCQQCSRFHPLQEFDNGKRSCRKRLADHNRRRRKFQQQQQQPLEDGKKQAASSSSSSLEASVSARSQEEDVARVGVMLECFGGRRC